MTRNLKKYKKFIKKTRNLKKSQEIQKNLKIIQKITRKRKK